MVAIFTGLGSGLERGSGAVLGGAGLLGSATFGRSSDQLFFNAATGNLVINQRDESLIGRGPDATISRTYNSLGNLTDDNGDNWRQSTDRRIFGLTGTVNTSGSTVQRRSADGSEIVYGWNGSAYVSTEGAGIYDTLSYNGGSGEWTWTDGDSHWTETYAASGGEWRITAQGDTSGNLLAFSYYSGIDRLYRVTTADGAYIQYSWVGNQVADMVSGYTDLLTNISKAVTRTRYSYDGSNRLSTVVVDLSPQDNTLADGNYFTTTYTYDGSSKRVASITHSDGSAVAIGYDGSGRVTSFTQTVSSGVTRGTTIAYGSGYTSITDAASQVTTLEYNSDGSLKKITAPPAYSGAAAQTVQYAYNGYGDLTSVTDSLGGITTYADYVDGVWATATDPNGNVTRRAFDANGNVLAETLVGSDKDGAANYHTTRYAYDAAQRLRFVISAEGNVTEYRYDRYGQRAAQIVYSATRYDTSALWLTTPVATGTLETWVSATADRTAATRTNYFYDLRGNVTRSESYETLNAYGQGVASSLAITAATNTTVAQLADGMYQVTKTSGIANWDADAHSAVKAEGDFVLQMRVPQSDKYLIGGVSAAPAASASHVDPDYGLYFIAGGSVSSIESGGQTSLGTYAAGDSFWIARSGTTVSYYKGATFAAAVSAGALRTVTGSTQALYFDSSLFTMDAKLDVAFTPNDMAVTNTSVATLADGMVEITKTAGGGGWNADAHSSVKADGDFVLRARIPQTGAHIMVGLSTAPATSASYTDLAYIVYFAPDGSATAIEPAGGAYSLGTYVPGDQFWIVRSGSTISYYKGATLEVAISAGALRTVGGATGSLYFDSSIFGETTKVEIAFTRGEGATPPAGVRRTDYVYDQVGRLLYSADAGKAPQSYLYDGLDRVTSSVDVNGGTTSIVFNDTAGQTQITLANGLVQTSTYNKAGELVSFTDSGSYVAGGTANYLYDQNGRLRVSTDANGTTNYYLYDKAGRKIADINVWGWVTEYRYDANDRLVATAHYSNIIASAGTSMALLADPNSNVEMATIRPAADSKDVWTWSVYDASGRVIEAIEGDGSVTAYEYDQSDRLIKTTSFVNKLAGWQIAAFQAAAPTSLVLPSAHGGDSVARIFYDKDGRVIGTMDGEGYLSRIIYDAAGHKVQEIAYSNAAYTPYYVYGFELLIVTTTWPGASDNHVARYVYDDQGQLRFAIDALNHVTEYSYDAAGLATRTVAHAGTLPALSDYDYATVRDAVALIAGGSDRTAYAVYDRAGRLAYAIDAAGAVTGYVYDTVGAVIRKVEHATPRSTTSLPGKSEMDGWATSYPSSADRVTRYYHNARGELRFTVDAEGFVTRNDYDAEGRLTFTVRWNTAVAANDSWTLGDVHAAVGGDWAGTNTYYDASGRVTLTSDQAGRTRRYYYHATGQLAWDIVSEGTADESRTTYLYDATGRIVARYAAQGTAEEALTQYAYDGRGNLVTETDPSGHATTRTYDHAGQLLSETNAIGGTVTYQYDAFGNAVKVTDTRGNSSYTYYDKTGRMVASRDAEDYVTETSYTVFGEVASVTRHGARVTNTAAVGALPAWTWASTDVPATTSFEYDKLGRLTKSIDALTAYEQYTLDAFGQRVTVRGKLGGITTNSFDRRGLLVSESIAVSANYGSGGTIGATIVNNFEYDARGNRITTVEGYGTAEVRTTRYYFDKADRLIEKRGMAVAVGTAGTSTIPHEYYYYDARGNLIASDDPAGARTLYYYDDLNRKIAEIDALGTYSKFTYDAAGNMTLSRTCATAIMPPGIAGGSTPTAPGGDYRETYYAYDNINRLITSTIGGPQFNGSWNGSSYDTTSSAATTAYQYDAAGNVVKTTAPDGGEVFTYYDKNGRKIAQADQEGYFTYWWLDAEGNVTQEVRYATATSGATVTSMPSLAYVAADRLSTFDYDKNGRRIAEVRHHVAAKEIRWWDGTLYDAATGQQISYTYNALGQVTRKTEATGDYTDYTYDNAGRLIVETHVGLNYGLSVPNPTVRYYYNALDGLTGTRQGAETVAGGDRFTANTYGIGGRLESSTDAGTNVRSFVYDIAGRVIGEKYSRITTGTTSVDEGIATTYDALGRTVRQSVNTISGTTWSEVSFVRTAYNAYDQVQSRSTNSDSFWQEAFHYDYAGNLIKTNTGDGVWRHYLYDKAGRQTMAIESEGVDVSGWSTATALANAYTDGVNATITAYDKRGQALKTIQTQRELLIGGTRQNLVTERSYNAFGEVAWEKDANLNQTDYSYNTMGRLVQIQRPTVVVVNDSGAAASLRPTERIYYDRSGRLIGSEDANSVAASAGRITTRLIAAGTGYGDSEAMVLKEWHLDSGTVTRVFDIFGDMTSQMDEVGRVTAYEYDALGHVTKLTHPGSGALIEYFGYDSLGQRISHTNNASGGHGAETTEYDTMGRVVRTRAFGGDITTIAYAWNSAIQATDGASPIAAAGGWTTTTTYANTRIVTESTDLYGHVTSHTDMGSHVTTYTYDRAGRMTNRTIGGVTVHYDWVNTGRMGRMINGAGTGESFVGDRTDYSYDASGNLLTEHYLHATGAWVEYGHFEYEDFYPYDQYWVVDGSNWVVTPSVIQDSTATYDALNRLVTWDSAATDSAPVAGIDYQYDANSNIRRSTATFRALDQYGTASGTDSVQDYWYAFDTMNRVVTAKGTLSGGAIVRGALGADYSYDGAGQRKTVTTGAGSTTQREDYSYDDDGHLLTVRIAANGTATPPTLGALKSQYGYDAQGRQTRQYDYLNDGDSDSTAAYDRQVIYNAKGQVTDETIAQKQGGDLLVTTVTNTYATGTPSDYALGAVLFSSSNTDKNGSWNSSSSTTNGYVWRDGAVIDITTIVRAFSSGPGTSNYSQYYYDPLGTLYYVYTNGPINSVVFTTDMAGQVVRRRQSDIVSPTEIWYRFGGKQMGYTGNNGTDATGYQASIDTRTTTPGSGPFRGGASTHTAYADFDQSLAPINSFGHGGAGSSYTAEGGESLSQLAQQMWGDSGLWYKLAQANGVAGDIRLGAGQTIAVPAGVLRSTHSATTFTPYDPAAAIGDTSPQAMASPIQPTMPRAKKGCGVVGQILMIAVTMAVAAALPGIGTSIGTALGSAIGGSAGAAIGAGVGAALQAGLVSVVSQGIGVVTRLQDQFSWKAVGLAALSAGITKGLDASGAFKGLGIAGEGWAATGARGLLSEAVTQGVATVTRLQPKFDFAGVAAAGIGDAIGAKIPGRGLSSRVARFGASALAMAASRSVIDGTSFGDNIVAALPSVIGRTLGSILADGVSELKMSPGERAVVAEARKSANSKPAGQVVEAPNEGLQAYLARKFPGGAEWKTASFPQDPDEKNKGISFDEFGHPVPGKNGTSFQQSMANTFERILPGPILDPDAIDAYIHDAIYLGELPGVSDGPVLTKEQKSQLTFLTAAELSYDIDNTVDSVETPDGKYRIVNPKDLHLDPNLFNQPSNGLNAKIWTNGGAYIFTITGSQGPLYSTDWRTNYLNELNFQTAQYREGVALASQVKEALQGKPLFFSGHSLAGGILSIAGSKLGVPTIVFDAAGVPDGVLNALGGNRESKNVWNIAHRQDPLTSTHPNIPWVPNLTAPMVGQLILVGRPALLPLDHSLPSIRKAILFGEK